MTSSTDRQTGRHLSLCFTFASCSLFALKFIVNITIIIIIIITFCPTSFPFSSCFPYFSFHNLLLLAFYSLYPLLTFPNCSLFSDFLLLSVFVTSPTPAPFLFLFPIAVLFFHILFLSFVYFHFSSSVFVFFPLIYFRPHHCFSSSPFTPFLLPCCFFSSHYFIVLLVLS